MIPASPKRWVLRDARSVEVSETFILTVTYLLISAIGLGHNISNCPKLEDTQRRQMALHRADRGGGGY